MFRSALHSDEVRSGEEYTAAMIDAYQSWQEPSLIQYYPRALLSQAIAPTTETD